MPPTNTAALLPSPKAPTLTIGPAPYSSPSAGELVIKTHAVAINPADWCIQRLGILISAEDGYPCILGCDVAGVVVELPKDAPGELISKFKVGDRVISNSTPLSTKDGKDSDLSPEELKSWRGKKIYAYSGFQSYVVLRSPFIVKIPAHISFEDATVLPLGVTTAASCLFPPTMLGLEMPPLDAKAETKNKILLVWGASSSIGSCGVQFATQAGYSVIGIASERNHEMVTSLGAIKCFDHSSSTIVDDILSYLTTTHPTAEIVGAYDAISKAPTLGPLCEILHRAGGRKFIGAIFPGAEQHSKHDVEIIVNLTQGMEQFERVSGKVREWLERALQDGRMKCMPPKEVMGQGWGSVQGAMDKLAEGKVSGRKLVVAL